MYVLIEGIDTVGKTTQIDILRQKYPTAIITKEPGGTELGKDIRDIVLSGKAKSKVAEMLLFLADRAEHAFEIVKQNPDEVIISDRGIISGIAYAKDVPLDIATSLNLMALNGVVPDKIVFMKLSKEELEKRLSQKKADSIEDRGVEYLLEVQNRMKEAIDMLGIKHIVIDASTEISSIAKQIDEFI
jgi:dTMP kinase